MISYNQNSSRGNLDLSPKPSLLPDEGEEDHPDGYEEFRQQGVPEETIEKWEGDGHDLERMSDARAQEGILLPRSINSN